MLLIKNTLTKTPITLIQFSKIANDVTAITTKLKYSIKIAKRL